MTRAALSAQERAATERTAQVSAAAEKAAPDRAAAERVKAAQEKRQREADSGSVEQQVRVVRALGTPAPQCVTCLRSVYPKVRVAGLELPCHQEGCFRALPIRLGRVRLNTQPPSQGAQSLPLNGLEEQHPLLCDAWLT
jgi:hypothetical protein